MMRLSRLMYLTFTVDAMTSHLMFLNMKQLLMTCAGLPYVGVQCELR